MIKTHKNSRMRIWNENLLNNRFARTDFLDQDAIILQVEHVVDDKYVVEIINREDYFMD